MSMDLNIKKERGVESDTELWIGLCKMTASVIRCLPKDDQEDLLEVLKELVNSHTKDEMDAAEETIREMMQPKTGTIVKMILPKVRHTQVQKWADYAGGRVRELRKQAGLTQEELAKRSGLPQSHISRIEGNEISPNRATLTKIAKALNMPLSRFDPSA